MDINERFKWVMEQKGLNVGSFAETIGVAQATISHILSGRNKPSTDVILRLYDRYPDVHLEWLLTGKGEPTELSTSFSEADEGMLPLFQATTDQSPILPNEQPKPEIIYRERPPRKITAIYIYYDDNTYEVLKPEK
jgi:transcriptional regulator with XRE-family HTH domain